MRASDLMATEPSPEVGPAPAGRRGAAQMYVPWPRIA